MNKPFYLLLHFQQVEWAFLDEVLEEVLLGVSVELDVRGPKFWTCPVLRADPAR